MMMGTAFVPVAATGGPRFAPLLSAGGWSCYGLAAIVLFVFVGGWHIGRRDGRAGRGFWGGRRG